MQPETFHIPSSRGDIDLSCYRVVPEGTPKATIMMIHGMVEHILRYNEFADYLLEQGIAVYGYDQLGHGRTSPDDQGFIADRDGDKFLVDDVRRVEERVASDYPDVPHYVFGHSMGSLVMRRYMAEHGDTVDGVILMGTGDVPRMKSEGALAIVKVLKVFRGTHGHSRLMDNQVFAGFNDRVPEEEGRFGWLSRDCARVRNYTDDPCCGFNFTLSAYGDLMTLLKRLSNEEHFDHIPKDLRILMVSGTDDPFGGYGKGVEKVGSVLESYGLHPDVVMYEGARHSLVDETNRADVFKDISDWMLSRD